MTPKTPKTPKTNDPAELPVPDLPVPPDTASDVKGGKGKGILIGGTGGKHYPEVTT